MKVFVKYFQTTNVEESSRFDEDQWRELKSFRKHLTSHILRKKNVC